MLSFCLLYSSLDHGDGDGRDHSLTARGSHAEEGKSDGSRSPTLEECKVLIRQLQLKNQQQGNEV